MISSTPKSVAIIGASVGGLTAGLVLKKYGIQPRFFELRDQDYYFGGAVSLTPNGLRVLESIGAHSRIKSQGFDFEAITFMTDPEYETTGKLYFGQKDAYGYDGMRITRKVLNHELTEMAKEAGVEINYGKKFTKIVHEDANGVIFEFADGTQEKAEMLIGADGIYSKVRSCIFPDIYPLYSGHLALTYCIPRANMHMEENLPLPVSLRGEQGSFIISPQGEGGKEILIGRQLKYEQKDRSRWDTLLQDKQALIDMIQRDPKAWSPLVQAVQAEVTSPETDFLHVWPFYTVPKMDRWHSLTGRVVILGDAAHAVPPPAGQGANQALEDSYSFAMLLANLNSKVSILDALKAWEAYRMERMDKVLRLTNRVMTLRMTEEERASMPEEMRWDIDGSNAGKSELEWLYLVDIDRDVKNLVKTLDARDR
jgi:2-polyprenyl-6-methoxyphenol hydroxylase-like FAD-dependent oxidoreductase